MANKKNYSKENFVKKSGAKYSRIKNGNFTDFTCINAWKMSQHGLIKCSVMPYHASGKTVHSERSEYVKMIARIDYPSGVEKVLPCLMNVETQVVVLKEVGWCITPNGSGTTSNGKNVTGYFGQFTK
jgi:hypothetical protein